MVNKMSDDKKSISTMNADKKYEQLLGSYYSTHFRSIKSSASKKIKQLLTDGYLPNNSELVFDLGRFLYMEMESDNIAIEWLAISLIYQASSSGLKSADKFLELCIKNHRAQAKKGSILSQSLLGRILVLKDPSSNEAGKWLEKAAERGDSESEFILSKCYLSGLCGLEKNNELAKKYAQMAVNNGNHEAAYNLALFYLNGVGCKQDIQKAEEYLIMAQKAGHPNAKIELAKIYSRNDNTHSELDTSLESLLLLKKLQAEVQEIKNSNYRNTERVLASNNANRNLIIDNINAQSNLTRLSLSIESEKIRSEIAEIPKKTVDLIFVNLDKVKSEYMDSLSKFEAVQNQIQSDISNIKDVVGTTNTATEKLISEMQSFYNNMDKECKNQANSPTCRSLRNACKAELSSIFGEYWKNEYLLESTRESLIAARVLLACAEREDICDCRGIVISATSALERELKARFYTGIRQYFQEHREWDGKAEENLPKNLQNKSYKNEERFTLGDVKFILTCESFANKYPQNGYSLSQIACLRNYLNSILSNDILLGNYKYAGECYKEERPEDIFIFNGKPTFTDKLSDIKNNYRNPAAHTNDTSKSMAEKCCEDIIIGQENKEIKRIEGLLFELLRLTENFKHTNIK